MIGVPQRSQLPFEQNTLPLSERFFKERQGVTSERGDALAGFQQLRNQVIDRQGRPAVQMLEEGVLEGQRVGDASPQSLLVSQVGDLDSQF